MTMHRVELTPWPRNPERTLFTALPELRTIWREDLSAIAMFHTRQWETDPEESGNILIAHAGNDLVGVTGWYRMTLSEAGLRWHGVLPHARRNGFSKQMIELACQDMPRDVRHVYEVTRNEQSALAFCRCGFEVVTDTDVIQSVVEQSEYDIEGGGWVLRKTLRV